jgi:hypothetical protein
LKLKKKKHKKKKKKKNRKKLQNNPPKKMEPKQKSNSGPPKKIQKIKTKTNQPQKYRNPDFYKTGTKMLIFPQKNYDKTKQPISSTEEKSSVFITYPVEYPP